MTRMYMNAQSLFTRHMTMELGFIPTRGIFAFQSSDHTSRTISHCSKNHSLSIIKESQRINYTTFATPCKGGFESFLLSSILHLCWKNMGFASPHQQLRRQIIQLSKVNSLTGKCCSCLSRNTHIISHPTLNVKGVGKVFHFFVQSTLTSTPW